MAFAFKFKPAKRINEMDFELKNLKKEMKEMDFSCALATSHRKDGNVIFYMSYLRQVDSCKENFCSALETIEEIIVENESSFEDKDVNHRIETMIMDRLRN
jgi:hypothetical protein